MPRTSSRVTSLTDTQREYIACLSEGEENALTAKDVAILAGTADSAAYAMLRDLYDAGRIERVGNGGRWKPYRYFKITSKSPNTNATPVTVPNSPSSQFPEIDSLLASFKTIVAERDEYKNEAKRLEEILNNIEVQLLNR